MTALKRMMQARNMKQIELAKKLGISRATVSMQVKTGIRSINTAKRYANVMDCSPVFLIEGLSETKY